MIPENLKLVNMLCYRTDDTGIPSKIVGDRFWRFDQLIVLNVPRCKINQAHPCQLFSIFCQALWNHVSHGRNDHSLKPDHFTINSVDLRSVSPIE